jgi:hypothetical protein
VYLVKDGVPSGRLPPPWERILVANGYDPAAEGAIGFAVHAVGAEAQTFDDIRSALREARFLIDTGSDPWDVVVAAETSNGRSVVVVTGSPVIGMAIGALEDPPISVIEGPSVLPRFAPGERPARAVRGRRGGPSRG